MRENKIRVSKEEIAEFCRRSRVRKLSLFGSVLRDNFRDDSDIDVLVEFEPGGAHRSEVLCHAGRAFENLWAEGRFEHAGILGQAFPRPGPERGGGAI